MFPKLAEQGVELLRRTFDIRPGELRRVSLMGTNIFLIISTLMIIKPVVNALFLSYVGIKSLPSLFLLVSSLAMLVSVLYARALHRVSLHRMILRTYQVSIPVMVVIGILLHLGWAGKWLIYVFYIGEVIFALLTTSQFWILANLVFNPLEAKRLFSLVGAGAIAGGVMGGYITSVFAPLLSNENLLFLAAGLLAGGFFVNRTIWKDYITPDQIRSTARTDGLKGNPLQVIRRSRHLTLLALIVGISIVIAKLVEYQYSALASAAYPNADRLAAFFGFWFSTFNIISLVIQIFITRRVVGVYGVGKSLFVLPLALFGGATLVLITPVLWAGIALKLFDVSIKQSINKAAIELLILPIPLATKSQAKTFIDVFVDTAATGIGGLLLLFVINGLNLPLRAVSLLIILLIGLWIRFAYQIRKEYVRSFQENLEGASPEKRKDDPDLTDQSVLEGMRRVLRTGTESQLLFVLGKIVELKEIRLIPDTLPLLGHESAAVRTATLRCLYFHPDHGILSRIEPFLQDPDAEVRYHAFTAILRHARRDRVQLIHRYLQDDDPIINGAALVGLAMESRNNPEMQRIFEIGERVADKTQYLGMISDPNIRRLYKIMIIRAIGHGRIRSQYGLLDRFLADEDPAIRQEVLLAMGLTEAPEFIPVLLDHLPGKPTRDVACKALSQYGVDLIPHLQSRLDDQSISREQGVFLPVLFEDIHSPRAVSFLFEMVRRPDIGMRLAALRSLQVLRDRFPDLHISEKEIIRLIIQETHLYKDTLGHLYTQRLLQDQDEQSVQQARKELATLLERRLDGTLDRIFHLLGLKYSPAQINPIYEGIKGQNPNVRFNAVEFLDNILEPDLKKILIPIIESTLIDPATENALQPLNLTAPTEQDCFDQLIQGRDEKIKLAVIRVMNESGDPENLPRYRTLVQSTNPRIRKAAQEGLDRLSS
ncbi:MAG: hypothetical protein H6568_11570 [Lewinellaceae bacterium]|nr:hypothetical protein [Saprospiraceae bacterium]MCB9313391.1 hypothetical protein [Lewinellaceae bacterium]